MNSTERAYASRLERLKLEGKIANYWFEAHRLPLDDEWTYMPDFLVRTLDGAHEHHEIKAMHGVKERTVGWQGQGKPRFYWAKWRHKPVVFVLAARHRDGSWHLEEFNGQSATITPEERKAGRSGVYALLARNVKASTSIGRSEPRRRSTAQRSG
jgi:hypothetical protein